MLNQTPAHEADESVPDLHSTANPPDAQAHSPDMAAESAAPSAIPSQPENSVIEDSLTEGGQPEEERAEDAGTESEQAHDAAAIAAELAAVTFVAPDDQAAEASAASAPEAPAEPEIIFADLGLSEPILRAIEEKGYKHPTPIQAQAIPAVLSGRDVMGVAQTGTGKTASFTLPMLDILSGSRSRARMPRSLILEPTRELALQVAENFVEYGKYLKLNHALLIGGESLNDQKEALMKGVDVLIATPGRLIDLFERGGLMLTDAKLLVIDEADRMLDMGFIPDVERIVAMLPKTRQTLFFSATMAPEIRRLSDAFLDNPRMITVSKSASVATTIVAGLALVAEHDKREALRRLIRSEDVSNALIFCNRKRDVDILFKSLTRHGFSAGSLHGDMSQPARFATLDKFKKNELRLLVCSDVAARGIDIGGLSHVFNFDVPQHAEDYVHRIGRTGRAGLTGHAFTLCSPDDKLAVDAIEKLTGFAIPRIVVPELDVVDWSEGDGRKRRGRAAPARGRAATEPRGRAGSGADSGTKPARTPRAEAESGSESAKPRKARGRGRSADRAAPLAAQEAPAQSELTEPVQVVETRPQLARQDQRPRGPRPERAPERNQEPRQERVEAPLREQPRAESRYEPRQDRRDFRRRDDDLGPAVLGFGDEVPAFMTLPRRPALAQTDQVPEPAEA